MRIIALSEFVKNELENHTLNNSTVVIDGQNFFFKSYQKSHLQFMFGCESDKYACFLRKRLSRFKEANVNCHFIFKGGHVDITKKLKNMTVFDHIHGSKLVVGECHDGIVLPIYMKEVYKQVLEEMEFNYVICEFESKKECIAYAQKHKCPLISFDVEFCFSGVPYVPYNSFYYRNKTLECGLFTLEKFLQKHNLTEDKLAIFIVLTDQTIFPENHFLSFIKSLKAPMKNFEKLYLVIINWLAKTDRTRALGQIFRYKSEDKEKFLEELTKVKNMLRRKETPGVPTNYLDAGNKVEIVENDQKWFEKGVAGKHISIPLINLYRSNITLGSWAIADQTADDALMFSMEIIKYAYNLLTNFQKEKFTFMSKNESIPITVTDTVQKPNYVSTESMFENGWDRLRSFRLFEHFLAESLQGFNFQLLKKLPEDARLLVISLIYFSRKKPVRTMNEVCSILLSYVALSFISEEIDMNNNDFKTKISLTEKSIGDSTTNKNKIIKTDILTASAILKKYFGNVSNAEAIIIFDCKLVHPLVEYQHCLEYMNYLNKLCGCPYKPTIYSKTYNGTFVYKILYTINKDYAGNSMDFLKNELNPAATVFAFLKGLIELYEEALFQKSRV